jgi:hypothetical protein
MISVIGWLVPASVGTFFTVFGCLKLYGFCRGIIRGFCNHYRTDHSSKVFSWLTNWTLRSFCKWVSRRSGKMTPGKAFRKLTRVPQRPFDS